MVSDEGNPLSRTLADHLPRVGPGDTIAEKYVVESELGSGGMGQILAARHKTLGSPVAIKLLRATIAADRDAVARFRREALAMAKLRGEHLVRIHDVGQTEHGVPFIVMERLEGQDLDALVRRGQHRLPPGEVIEYALQACEALAEAHDAGIVHRDLKPRNLFLARSPTGKRSIRVIDFGLAKGHEADSSTGVKLTLPGTIVGTLRYMAPEQLNGDPVDLRTDVWGLGQCMYRLLTGSAAFPQEGHAELVAAILGGHVPRAPHELCPAVSSGLSAVVMRCLAHERSERFATMRDLADALRTGASSAASSVVSRTRIVAATATAPGTSAMALPALAPPASESPLAPPVMMAEAPSPSSYVPGVLLGLGIAAVILGIGGVLLVRGLSLVTSGTALEAPALPVPAPSVPVLPTGTLPEPADTPSPATPTAVRPVPPESADTPLASTPSAEPLAPPPSATELVSAPSSRAPAGERKAPPTVRSPRPPEMPSRSGPATPRQALYETL